MVDFSNVPVVCCEQYICHAYVIDKISSNIDNKKYYMFRFITKAFEELAIKR